MVFLVCNHVGVYAYGWCRCVRRLSAIVVITVMRLFIKEELYTRVFCV